MREKGFTLIELIVTVTIVGILASLSVSLFDEYRKKAYNAIALSWGHDLEVSMETQIADHGSASTLLTHLEGLGYSVANGGSTSKQKSSDWDTFGSVLFANAPAGSNEDLVGVADLSSSGYSISYGHCKATSLQGASGRCCCCGGIICWSCATTAELPTVHTTTRNGPVSISGVSFKNYCN